MQDRYIGDVGDFGKYVLLNEIYKNSDEEFKLGVNWYYVTREERKTGDGRHTNYLSDDNPNSKKYRNCFPNLYDRLRRIVNCGQRNLREIEISAVLPKETIFYSKPAPYSSRSPVRRIADRENWFEESLAKLKMADIILLDPDNGIPSEKVKKTHKKAIKYVFTDEIQRYYESGKSLIIYTHRDRTPQPGYKRKLLSITTTLPKAWGKIKVLKFKRVSVRHYVFLIQNEHNDLIVRTIENLTREPCNFLFEEYPLH